ncbi:uncharacterized protein EI90DRAFT_3035447 [Cantharellus anzutake]|uniref:uncharacterized protein n=1 Tax=Cantharellus anzutake TaxID=1750568 RepID=UPI001905AA63|nr:uncharacterized protein EI90DRAFT_3035447 [Cantharellus anzutake]KAF8340405.1 hypothetical protein EI90DRAFT_3035447 [Cantharellus anzutake]
MMNAEFSFGETMSGNIHLAFQIASSGLQHFPRWVKISPPLPQLVQWNWDSFGQRPSRILAIVDRLNIPYHPIRVVFLITTCIVLPF